MPGSALRRDILPTPVSGGASRVGLDDLGPRVCVMGPSNSGKSTLADAIARWDGREPVHLDRLRHLPGSDWLPRPEAEFAALHDEAIGRPRWVMDGNYSGCLPQRLARATGLVLLDVPTATSLLRYVRRCWFERDRCGALDGGRDSVKWEMIRHIAVDTRRDRARYRAMFDRVDLPKVMLASTRDLSAFYASAGLHR